MNARRTKNQKVQARHEYVYRFAQEDVNAVNPIHPAQRLSTQMTAPLLLTPRAFIVSDLIKIVIFSTIMLAVEWLLYRTIH